jgi:ankyrin repeat protein
MRYLFFLLVLNLSFAQTTIFEVARSGTVEEMNVLFQSDARLINSIDKRGSSPLTLAAYHNNINVVNYLIDKVENVNGESKDGTPLMGAVVKGHTAVVKSLIQAGADPNLSDANGTTALHYAVMFKNYSIVSLLMDANANINYKNSVDQSPLDFAKMHNDERLNKILNSK